MIQELNNAIDETWMRVWKIKWNKQVCYWPEKPDPLEFEEADISEEVIKRDYYEELPEWNGF